MIKQGLGHDNSQHVEDNHAADEQGHIQLEGDHLQRGLHQGQSHRNHHPVQQDKKVQTTTSNKPHQALQTDAEVEKHQADAKAASEHQTASDIMPPKAQVQVSMFKTNDAAVYLPLGDNSAEATIRQQTSADLETHQA